MSARRAAAIVLSIVVACLAPVSPVGAAPIVHVANSDVDTVARIDLATMSIVGTTAVGDTPTGIAFTTDGSAMWVANNEADSISIIDTDTWSTSHLITVPSGWRPVRIASAPDGRMWVAMRSADLVSGRIVAFDVEDYGMRASIPTGGRLEDIIVADGGGAVFAASMTGQVHRVDPATNELMSIDLPGTNRSLALSRDGRTVFVGASSRVEITKVDVATGSIVGDFAADFGLGIGASPDGRSLHVARPWGLEEYPIDGGPRPEFIPLSLMSTMVIYTHDDAHVLAADLGSAELIRAPLPWRSRPIEKAPTGGYPIAIAIQPNQAPRTALQAPATAIVGVPVRFDASGSTDDGQIVEYEWAFGDGTSVQASESVRTHTYAAPGTRTVRVTAVDEYGCSTTETTRHDGRNTTCNGGAWATRSVDIVVDRRSTTTSITCADPVLVVGTGTTCTITTADASPGNAASPAGTATVVSDGVPVGSCHLYSQGARASCTVDLPAGAAGVHLIGATFDGDSIHHGSRAVETTVTTSASSRAAAPVKSGRFVVEAAGALRVPCVVDAPTMTRCTVRVIDARGRQLGAGVASSPTPVRRLVVGIRLSSAAHATLAGAAGGLAVRFELRVDQVGEGADLVQVVRSRLAASRVVVLPTRGMFAPDSWKPSRAAVARTRVLARQVGRARHVVCVGYTSGTRTTAFGRRLSLARARSVCALLRAAGVRARTTAYGRGSADPIASNATEAGRERNRRVVVTIYR